MKLLLFFTLIFSSVGAQDLQEILQSLKSSSKTKAVHARRDAEIIDNALIQTYKAPVFEASLSHAKDPVDEGLEYSVGVSHELSNPFSTDEKKSISLNLSKAATQEAKHELHIIKLNVASQYYEACVSRELQDKANTLYKEQSTRVSQLTRAYELGEISKKELLFNQLDLANLNKSSKVYTREYLEDFNSLQESLDNLRITSLSCMDLKEPIRNIDLRDVNEHGELKILQYKKTASKALYKINDANFQNIGYNFSFEQELETRRYTVGVNFPLGGLSSYQESIRKRELSKISSYEFQKESLKVEILNASQRILVKIETLFDELTLLQEEILPLNAELLLLAKSAHIQGEGTLMEYLDASRSYAQNVLDMLEIKKTYYQELFELYKMADMEYGEQI